MPKTPLAEVELRDIFEKDPENYTSEDRARILTFYRDWRAKHFEAVEEKERKKRVKKAGMSLDDAKEIKL